VKTVESRTFTIRKLNRQTETENANREEKLRIARKEQKKEARTCNCQLKRPGTLPREEGRVFRYAGGGGEGVAHVLHARSSARRRRVRQWQRAFQRDRRHCPRVKPARALPPSLLTRGPGARRACTSRGPRCAAE